MPKREPTSLTKVGKWKRAWMGPFLAELEKMPNVSRASRVVGINFRMAYWWRDNHPDFAEAWKKACEVGVETLEEIAWNRAADPNYENPALIIFLLKSYKPERYRETRKVELGTTNNEPVVFEVRAMDYRQAVQSLAPIVLEDDDYLPDAEYKMLPAPSPANADDE